MAGLKWPWLGFFGGVVPGQSCIRLHWSELSNYRFRLSIASKLMLPSKAKDIPRFQHNTWDIRQRNKRCGDSCHITPGVWQNVRTVRKRSRLGLQSQWTKKPGHYFFLTGHRSIIICGNGNCSRKFSNNYIIRLATYDMISLQWYIKNCKAIHMGRQQNLGWTL